MLSHVSCTHTYTMPTLTCININHIHTHTLTHRDELKYKIRLFYIMNYSFEMHFEWNYILCQTTRSNICWTFEASVMEGRTTLPTQKLSLVPIRSRIVSWCKMELFGLKRNWVNELNTGQAKARGRHGDRKDKKKANFNSCFAYLKVLVWLLFTSQVNC